MTRTQNIFIRSLLLLIISLTFLFIAGYANLGYCFPTAFESRNAGCLVGWDRSISFIFYVVGYGFLFSIFDLKNEFRSFSFRKKQKDGLKFLLLITISVLSAVIGTVLSFNI